MIRLPSIIIFAISAVVCSASSVSNLFQITGKVDFLDFPTTKNWRANTVVLVNHGEHIGLIRADGSFVVEGVTPGSYIVEVSCVDYIFEPVRVDINSKGKARGRRLNLVQPNVVDIISYPLHLVPRQPTRYFRPREAFRVTDVLMNPMVIMLLVAFVLMVITPKITAQDPELQKEMQNMQLPKMEDMLANFWGGNQQPTKKAAGSSRKHK